MKRRKTLTDSTTSGKRGKVFCKGCGQQWETFGDYMKSDGCEKENCQMGKRWKARNAANAAIKKAKEQAEETEKEARFVCHVKTCHMPDQHDETKPYRTRDMSGCIAFHVMKQ